MFDPDAHRVSRRRMLGQAGGGFGALAASYLLGLQEGAASEDSPLAARSGHHSAQAKSVIFLFMCGGTSQIDTFDRKPLLNKMAGQMLPKSFGDPITPMGLGRAKLLAAPRTWTRHGTSGLWVSEWFPHVATCADDLAVINSCWTRGINHAGGVSMMNTGSDRAGRPSMGAWTSYGLGTENQNLPAFVVLSDTKAGPQNGTRMWGSSFLPAVHQGMRLHPTGKQVIANLAPPSGVNDARQRRKTELLAEFNEAHRRDHPGNSELDARIRNYELAFRMQATAPEAVDLGRESESTRRLYGMNLKETSAFGRNCLIARRLVERGVRFVQLYSGAENKWDSHKQIEKNHPPMCRSVDQPIAGLIKDLKQRGLLEQTLVVWGTEFGRTPMGEGADGRDHNIHGFTMWMAGGGVRGGQVIGETDELGVRAVKDPMYTNDVHASILHLMGLDAHRLTYFHKGRPERPTMNEGEFMRRLLA